MWSHFNSNICIGGIFKCFSIIFASISCVKHHKTYLRAHFALVLAHCGLGVLPMLRVERVTQAMGGSALHRSHLGHVDRLGDDHRARGWGRRRSGRLGSRCCR